jgi:uncharacterized protein (DUF302 family)
MTATDHPAYQGASVVGIVHEPSHFSVAVTIARLTEAIEKAGAKVFAVIDHSGEADEAGLRLRDTKVVIFGSPRAGTPVMQVQPLAALDLPLKILVWIDDRDQVWMSFASPAWLADRYGLSEDAARPLGAVVKLTGAVAAEPGGG